MNKVVDWINERKHEIRSHHVLSMLRLAEARFQQSTTDNASHLAPTNTYLFILHFLAVYTLHLHIGFVS